MCEQCQWCVTQISTTRYSHTQGRLTPEITIDSHTRMQPRTERVPLGAETTRQAAETPPATGGRHGGRADQTPVRTRPSSV
jgi:hypothetical protein